MCGEAISISVGHLVAIILCLFKNYLTKQISSVHVLTFCLTAKMKNASVRLCPVRWLWVCGYIVLLLNGCTLLQIWTWIDYSSAMVSLYHTSFLAYDRYLAIVHPLKYSKPNKLRQIVMQIASIYAICYALWLPPVLIQVKSGAQDLDCYIEGSRPMAAVVVLSNVLPLFVTTFIYLQCVCGLRRQFRKLHPKRTQTPPASDKIVKVNPNANRDVGILHVREDRSTSRVRPSFYSSRLPGELTNIEVRSDNKLMPRRKFENKIVRSNYLAQAKTAWATSRATVRYIDAF
jgi:7 transmembrane receptor (rhodopsin family)